MRSTSVLHAIGLLVVAACATTAKLNMSTTPPSPDLRVGLRAGWMNAASASWNLRLVSTTPPPAAFTPTTPGDFGYLNSDLAFTGHYVIQGNFHGLQVWDISQPGRPTLVTTYVCPDAQNDVSVYRNLLFVSGEDFNGRLDCGTQGVPDSVSKDRMRGIRIFDIGDIAHPKPVTAVQTCRGSHTHTVVTDPRDTANVYIYVSGSAPVRSPNELAGCSALTPDKDPAAEARAKGAFTARFFGMEHVLGPRFVTAQLDTIVKARGGTGAPTAADSATLRANVQAIVDKIVNPAPTPGSGPKPGPVQCHDITVYPAIGLAGGACAGYGVILDIRDPANPKRVAAAADSNFAYWHSATFNNDGTKVLFTDEWGGGLAPKCRATDKYEWGADAIFTVAGGTMTFRSYYKLPAPQTPNENCVAHNGSLIPIPGRDIMVQGWYQGGISVFDWTDPVRPREIAFYDRGPMDSTKLVGAGSWSAYWYNGYIVSSEIARGLDIFELQPSGFISQNEIDAAKLVHFDYLNVQHQPKLVWPASFVVARAYLDQLARGNGLAPDKVAAARTALARAERQSGQPRRDALTQLGTQLTGDAQGAADAGKVRTLAAAVKDLANAQP